MLVLDKNYTPMKTDFETKAVMGVVLFRFERGGGLWVHHLISQRPAKVQLHKLHVDLCAYPKNILHFNNQLARVKIVFFTTYL
jgi:hypothetical protein